METRFIQVGVTALRDPATGGFPVIVAKSRVKIPREPFLRFIKGYIPPAL